MKDDLLILLSIIIISIWAIIIVDGNKPGYMRTRYTSTAQLSEDRFCLDFARSLSGTVEYKITIYQDCKGD